MTDPPAALRPARRELHLTRAGRIFLPVAIAGLIGGWLAGGTTGMFAALSFALLALAPLTAIRHLAGLRIAPPPGVRIPVGDPFSLRPRLVNEAALFAVRNVLLAPGDARGGARRAGGVLLHLAPGEERTVPVAHRLLHRGRTRELSLVVTSYFPFGLVEVRLMFPLPVDLLGLPRIGTLGDLGLLPAGRAETSLARRLPVPGEEEFYAVRDWREGESLRRVHWRLTARRGRRILRDFQVPVEAPVHVVLLTGVPEEAPAGENHRRFEKAVSLAATLAEHYLRRGRRVRLDVLGSPPAALPSLRGRNGLARILTVLAEVRMEPGTESGPRPELTSGPVRGEVTIVVHAGDPRAPHPTTASLVLGTDEARTDRLFRRGRPATAPSPLSPVRP